MRATKSALPPADWATMNRTGRVGYAPVRASAAAATVPESAIAVVATAIANRRTPWLINTATISAP
jgi:hypothetical protein